VVALSSFSISKHGTVECGDFLIWEHVVSAFFFVRMSVNNTEYDSYERLDPPAEMTSKEPYHPLVSRGGHFNVDAENVPWWTVFSADVYHYFLNMVEPTVMFTETFRVGQRSYLSAYFIGL
jgi:hypothetical protein